MATGDIIRFQKKLNTGDGIVINSEGLQQKIDVNSNTVLKTSGGTMTGAIRRADNGIGSTGQIILGSPSTTSATQAQQVLASNATTYERTAILSGTDWYSGGMIALSGEKAKYNPGCFDLRAYDHNGTGGAQRSSTLIGKPDGTLTWNGSTLAVGDFLPLAGGTMTGQITLATSGYKTNHTDGYSTDKWGNFTHTSSTEANNWQISNNSGTATHKFNYESGNVEHTGTIKAAGGEMTGTIKFDGVTNAILSKVDNSQIEIGGGSVTGNGAYLTLRGMSNPNGNGDFFLVARNGTTSKTLAGKTDGTLTWDDKQLVSTSAATVGGTLRPVYISNNVATAGTQLYARKVTINGTAYSNLIRSTNSDLPSIYAPTSAGTSGQILKSSGSGAPTWDNFVEELLAPATVRGTGEFTLSSSRKWTDYSLIVILMKSASYEGVTTCIYPKEFFSNTVDATAMVFRGGEWIFVTASTSAPTILKVKNNNNGRLFAAYGIR